MGVRAGDLTPEATTIDGFLGGRFTAVQAASGHHRCGLDAILLAAAIEPTFTGTVVDLGAGSGVAGLAVAARCDNASVVLVDRDVTALACARAALTLPDNGRFAGRVRVVAADVGWPEAARAEAGLPRASAEAVIVNPPFYPREHASASPEGGRNAAHVLGEAGLDPWVRTAASVAKPGGRLFVIFRPDGLDMLLAACRGRFGVSDILPVHPRAGAPAGRIVVAAVQGSRARPRLLPPLVIHAADAQAFTDEAMALMRDGWSLAQAHAPWRRSAGA